MKVLIADDNRDLAENLGEILEADGHQVEVVHDGHDAVQRAASHLFDAVILDIHMPRKNGVEACIELRRAFPHLPVILITGYEDRADRALEVGAAGVFRKPIEVEKFLGLVNQCGGRRPASP
jgi:CheY-like chemotaxis protein